MDKKILRSSYSERKRGIFLSALFTYQNDRKERDRKMTMINSSLVCTKQPALQKAGNPMTGRKESVPYYSCFSHYAMLISLGGQTIISIPAIRFYLAADGYRTTKRPLERITGRVNDLGQTNSPYLRVFNLYGRQDKAFPRSSTPTFTRAISSLSTDESRCRRQLVAITIIRIRLGFFNYNLDTSDLRKINIVYTIGRAIARFPRITTGPKGNYVLRLLPER